LLILDELGYVPFTAVGGELLFEVLSPRCERASHRKRQKEKGGSQMT